MGRTGAAALALLTLLTVLAGCADDGGDGDDGAGTPTAIGTPVVQDHDHNDATLHTGRHALRQVAWSPLGVTLGENGFANFVMWPDADQDENGDPADAPDAAADPEAERLVLIAVDGDAEGGFLIVDAREPTDLRVLGRYWVPGNGIQEVRITPDGRFALMNVQEVPGTGAAGAGDPLGGCTLCIHVVDIQDRAAPRLVSVHPVELLGTHNLHVEEYGDGLYVFYVGQPLNLPWPDPGNHVWVARFEESPLGARLVPVASFDHNPPTRAERGFPHDVLVQDHPLTGQKVAYVSYWDSGLVLFDVSDPLVPVELAVLADPAPSEALAVHWAMMEPRPRADGRVIAYSAPEIQALGSGTGVIRTYDVTDPAAPQQVGSWEIPGDTTIDGRFLFSPHTAVPDMDRGLLAVAHYHAGVWVLDVSDPAAPEATAYYFPHGDEADPYTGPIWWKKPNFDPDGFGPNAYQARWRDGLLWVSDRGTGLYVLEYTGPVPGPQ